MKLNKCYLLILVLFSIVLISCENNAEPNQDIIQNNITENTYIDIVPYMLSGLENELIRTIYADDIRDVYEITYAKYIEIWYYETDLNDNGYNDYIVIVQSPLHSGSRGDSVDIWIYGENGEYHNVSGLSVARILEGNLEYNGKIYISDEKTMERFIFLMKKLMDSKI